MTFGEKVLFLRSQKGLSQKALGEAIGISAKTVGSYETKSVTPRRAETLEKIANLFGVTARELMDDSIDVIAEGQAVEDAEEDTTEGQAVEDMEVAEGQEVEDAAAESLADAGELSDDAAGEDSDEAGEPEDKAAETPIPMPKLPEPEPETAEAIRLVSRLSVLLAGNRLSRAEKDAVMISLNGAYWANR